ncbi:hypothetical protein CDAR_115221 [Caerostris darwini]|uniref:Uncharacterized protein n=1 Tax=Caerostris darwini TaxID=1538125 RepID=A0AAV4UA26_9ARAC|nr:hypothetical protein CDAR_115221 [Caerostris darwini]
MVLEPFVEIERPPIAPVKAPPPSPDLHRISDVSQGSDNSQASSHIIPPPPTFLPTDSPPMSPDNIPTYIPMEDLGNKTKVSLTREEINA